MLLAVNRHAGLRLLLAHACGSNAVAGADADFFADLVYAATWQIKLSLLQLAAVVPIGEAVDQLLLLLLLLFKVAHRIVLLKRAERKV